jgi:hypothetical protein
MEQTANAKGLKQECGGDCSRDIKASGNRYVWSRESREESSRE